MKKTINENVENEMMTFSEAKNKFISTIGQEIEKLHYELQTKFNAYANQKRNAFQQNIYLSVDFEDTIYKVNRLKKLFFVIESLKKLDLIATIQKTRNEDGTVILKKPIKYVYKHGYSNINLSHKMTDDKVKDINDKLKELSQFHWSNELKVKYSFIEDLGNAIINNRHEEFYNLLFRLLKNKDQTSKYTKAIFKKGIKNRTKEELKNR